MDLKKLFLSFVLCFGSAVLGGWLTAPAIPTWYESLIKPPLNPPNWVFGPVWSLLYVLMGIAFYVVWRKKPTRQLAPLRNEALRAFILQLLLNVGWSFSFFFLHSLWLGMVVILLLWFYIVYTLVLFRKISPVTTFLLLPYLLWVSFASYLNFGIWLVNR